MKPGKLIDNEELSQAVADALRDGVKEVYAVYAPEPSTAFPGWFSAAVDLFKPGQTYRVYFSMDAENHITIEHLQRWFMG